MITATDLEVRAGARTLLLTPQQIVNAAAAGVTVSEIRATMIEGDDTLGGYVVPGGENYREVLVTLPRGSVTVRTLSALSYEVLTTGIAAGPKAGVMIGW